MSPGDKEQKRYQQRTKEPAWKKEVNKEWRVLAGSTGREAKYIVKYDKHHT